MKHFDVLQHTPLFSGISFVEIKQVLPCLTASVTHYKKNEFVFHRGERITSVGLVLAGSVHIIKEDFWGNQTLLAKIPPGSIFGESYAVSQSSSLEVSVLATQETDIMFFDVKKVLTTCQNTCPFHQTLIYNLLQILANKNLILTQKIEHMSQKGIRQKILSFLSAQSLKHGNSTFEIPFNRQQLADYLCVDRSALSNELSKMQQQGIISYHKNQFTLKDKTDLF